jgi:asparagine synthase (glutamine-hydrolysing)
MFAFAVWDERRKQLLLGRDRLGIKPLYYAHMDGRVIFASELKAILQLPGVDRQLDWSAVNHLFTTLTTPSSRSIIRGIRKLEPAHVLTAGYGTPPRVSQYWDVNFEPNYRATTRDLIEESLWSSERARHLQPSVHQTSPRFAPPRTLPGSPVMDSDLFRTVVQDLSGPYHSGNL